jgi:hypothetical protein
MSIRRKVGDVVLVRTEDEEFLGRIDTLGADCGDECPQCFLDSNHDQHCREWPNVDVLNSEHKPTGRWAYHVSECRMFDLN